MVRVVFYADFAFDGAGMVVAAFLACFVLMLMLVLVRVLILALFVIFLVITLPIMFMWLFAIIHGPLPLNLATLDYNLSLMLMYLETLAHFLMAMFLILMRNKTLDILTEYLRAHIIGLINRKLLATFLGH